MKGMRTGGGTDAAQPSWSISGPGRGPTVGGGAGLGIGAGGLPQGKEVPPGALKVRWNPALYGVIPRAILYIVQRTQVKFTTLHQWFALVLTAEYLQFSSTRNRSVRVGESNDLQYRCVRRHFRRRRRRPGT